MLFKYKVFLFSSLVKKTEGFSPKDLGSLLDRAVHKAAIRKMKTSKGNKKTEIETLIL